MLAVIGALLLLLSLAGVALGSFMAMNRRTREPGVYFALWWIPAVAAAGGVLMRDQATFAIGTFCFLVAGTAFVLERRGSRRRRAARSKRRGPRTAKKLPSPEEAKRESSEKAEELPERARRWLSGRARTRK